MHTKIDAHSHFSLEHVKGIVQSMDENNIEVIVNAQRRNDRPDAEIARLSRALAGHRVATLKRIEFDGDVADPRYISGLVDQFRRDVDAGVKGLKISKRLGLFSIHKDGSWVRVDDERLSPVWEAAGEMNVPVLLHTADPIRNWMPLAQVEGDEVIKKFPSWWFGDGRHFDRLDLLQQRETVMKRHPKTIFVNAHWGCYPQDLDHLVYLFETYPNFVVDTEPNKIKITPKGKTHTSHRDLVIRYADRTLFGTDISIPFGKPVDCPWHKGMYERMASWLETEKDGGISLPDDVLRKLYYDTAKKVYHLD